MPYNKGDFTQQGINGDVSALVRLNDKRVVKMVLSSDDETSNVYVTGTVYDYLNGETYPLGGSTPPQGVEVTLAEEQTFTGVDQGMGEGIYSADLTLTDIFWTLDENNELPDSVDVVFDNTTYHCNKQTFIDPEDPDWPVIYYGADLNTTPIDWSVYPFSFNIQGWVRVDDENEHTIEVSFISTTIYINNNGTYDVSNVSSANVSIPSIITASSPTSYSLTEGGTTYYGVKWTDVNSEPSIIVMARTHAATSNSPILVGYYYDVFNEYQKVCVLDNGALTMANADIISQYDSDNKEYILVASDIAIIGSTEDPGMAFSTVFY